MIRALVATAALLTLVALVGSLGWPLVHDAPLMHYVAWQLSEGAVLYRDLYDFDLPGVFWIHAALLKTLGFSDLAWRTLDLLWLAASAGLIAALGSRLAGGLAGAAAAMLFCLYHLAGGPSDMGQRDFLMVPFLLAGAYGVAAFRAGGDRRALLLAGLAAGVTVTLKPFAAIFLVALAVASGWPRLRGILRDGLAFGLASAVMPVLIYGWLALTGGLAPFIEGLTGYLRTYYGSLGQQSWPTLFSMFLGPYTGPMSRLTGRLGLPEALGHGLVLAVVAAAVFAIARGLRHRPGPWRDMTLLGLGYGLLHYMWQAKGFAYHTYPLMAFGCVAATGLLLGTRRRQLALGAAIYALVAGFLGIKAITGPDRGWITDKVAVVDALEADLRPLVAGGGTVQVMDLTGGGIHALLRLKVRQPTKYLYDYHFYHPLDDSIRAMRREYVEALTARAPVAIVVFKHNALRTDYSRLEEFPELKALLDRRYHLAAERSTYRLYALSAPGPQSETPRH